MANPPPKKAFLELFLTAHIQSQSLTPSKTRIKPLICWKLIKIWLHFKPDPKLKFSPNVLLLGKWSISFAHNNFCLLQFSPFPNSTLRDAIRGGKIKQLKESHEIPRRPLIPISFKRVLAPNSQNIWFSGVGLRGFFLWWVELELRSTFAYKEWQGCSREDHKWQLSSRFLWSLSYWCNLDLFPRAWGSGLALPQPLAFSLFIPTFISSSQSSRLHLHVSSHAGNHKAAYF